MYEVVMTDRAYEWFSSRMDLIRRNMKRYPQNYDTEFTQLVDELEGAMLAAKQSRDPRAKTETVEDAPRKAPRKPAVPIRDGCTEHPTYGGRRRPQRDCADCWALYKKLNPMTYAKARRDFERKQKA